MDGSEPTLWILERRLLGCPIMDDLAAAPRADWGGLVLVFAEAAGQWSAWKQALEGWNVQTSQQVQEWQAEALQRGRAEGKAEGKAEAVIATLQLRFPKKLPKKLQQLVLQTTDLALLDQWFQTAHAADSLEDFRARPKL
jgi:flagellar biosynthesis/type III secretory pathway protein FliH